MKVPDTASQLWKSDEARLVVMSVWSQTLNALVLLRIAEMDAMTLAGISTALTTWTLLFGYVLAKLGKYPLSPPPQD